MFVRSETLRYAGVVAAFTFVAGMHSGASVQANYLQRCSRQQLNTNGVLERAPDATGETVSHFRQGFFLDCPVEKRRVVADSARHYATQQKLELMGNVKYTEGATVITSGHMLYTRRDDKVWATENVKATMASGSTINGQSIEYHARNSQAFPTGRMKAVQRPTFLLVEVDTTPSPADTTKRITTADSTTIVAETIISLGEEVFASGKVNVRRSDVDADADSMYGNRKEGERYLRLISNPSLRGKGEDPFYVKGNFIEIEAGEDKKIRRMQALGKGDFRSNDFSLASDTVDMHMDGKSISKALAMGDSGATMRHKGNTMVGNRLQILMPGGNLSEIKSHGSARADLEPDTATVRSTEKNFVKGDTVVITFQRVANKRVAPTPAPAPGARITARDSATRTDSAARAQPPAGPDSTDTPRTILAVGDASFFFQSAPRSGRGPTDCPTIDYWTGSRISATLEDGKPKNMSITAGRSGFVQGVNSECGGGRGTPGRPGGAGGRAGRGRAGTDTTAASPRIRAE